MQAETVVALISAGLAAVIAVSVPWFTFRLALRQDHVRWLREQRAELYVDLLTEAYAEERFFNHEALDPDDRRHAAKHFVDLRLLPMERARLGTRCNIVASRTVNRLFNRLWAEAFNRSIGGVRNEGERILARLALADALEGLRAAIRLEMGADAISESGPSTTAR